MNQAKKRLIGTILLLSPVVLIVMIWILMEPISGRFTDSQTILLSISRLSALVGLGLYSLSLVLHVRTKGLKTIFLDETYVCKLHHNLGSIAMLLLLIHPMILAFRIFHFAQNDYYFAAKFLLSFDNQVNMIGLISLFIMSATMVVTYYFKKKPQLWLWVHRAMLVAYVGAFNHLTFVASDTSGSPALKFTLIVLMALGLIAFIDQRLSRSRVKMTAEPTEVC